MFQRCLIKNKAFKISKTFLRRLKKGVFITHFITHLLDMRVIWVNCHPFSHVKNTFLRGVIHWPKRRHVFMHERYLCFAERTSQSCVRVRTASFVRAPRDNCKHFRCRMRLFTTHVPPGHRWKPWKRARLAPRVDSSRCVASHRYSRVQQHVDRRCVCVVRQSSDGESHTDYPIRWCVLSCHRLPFASQTALLFRIRAILFLH